MSVVGRIHAMKQDHPTGARIHHSHWRGVALWGLLGTTAVIIVGSLAPFRFDAPLSAGMSDYFGFNTFRWTPGPVSDVVANVLIYVPMGAFAALLGRCAGLGRVRSVTVGTLLGLLMSLALEWTQTMSTARVASWLDLCLNGTGTLIGASAVGFGVVGMAWLRMAAAIRVRTWSMLSVLATLGVASLALSPFDFVTSTAALEASMRQSRLWFCFGLADGSEMARSLLMWVGYAGQFAIVGFVKARACRERGDSTRDMCRSVIAHVVLVAGVIEMSQLFVASHAMDVMDCLAGALGGFVGLGLGMIRLSNARWIRATLGVLVVGHITWLVGMSAWPYDLTWAGFADGRWSVIPFGGLAMRPFGAAMADLIAAGAAFGMFGMLIWLTGHGLSRWMRFGCVVGMLVGVAFGCEALQLASPTRYADITGPVLALLVAVTICLLEPVATGLVWSVAPALGIERRGGRRG